jgi:hypothetical protein
MPDIWPDLSGVTDEYLDSGTDRPSLALPAMRATVNAVKSIAALRNQPNGVAGLRSDGTIDPALVGGTPQPNNALLTVFSNLELSTALRLVALRLVTGNPEAVSIMLGAIAPSLLTCADAPAISALLNLEVGTDVIAYTARLNAFRLLLDTLATAGEVDPETGDPTALSCLLRYGPSGVEADTTAYVRPEDLSALPTLATLDSRTAELVADIAAEYLTMATADDRYIPRTDEALVMSQIYGSDFTADTSPAPFFTAVMAGGTVSSSNATANAAQLGHHGIIGIITNTTATIDSGVRMWTGISAIYMSGGQWFQMRFSLSSITDVSHRIGFHDQATLVAVVNGVYFGIVNGTLTAYSTASSVSSSSVYGTSLAINTWYRAVIQFVAPGDLAVLQLYNDDTGALLFSAAFSTNLPLNQKCGAGFIMTATTAVATKTLALIDSMHYKARN